MPEHEIGRDGAVHRQHLDGHSQAWWPQARRVPSRRRSWAPSRPRIDNTLLRAVVQAFHWKQQLDSGRFATISELAEMEKLDRSFVSHTLRLTLLAPDLVEAILDGNQPRTMELQTLMRDPPVGWVRQRPGSSGR